MWYGDNFGKFVLRISCVQGILRDTIFSTKDGEALLLKMVPLKMPCMQDVRRANLLKWSPYHMMNGSPSTRSRSRLTRHLSALYMAQQEEKLCFLWAVNTRASLVRIVAPCIVAEFSM